MVDIHRHEKTEMTLLTLPEATLAKKDRSIHSSTGYWVTRLARAMECDFENRLKVHGVSRAGCAILSAIANDGRNTPAALASFIGIDGAAITRHLDRLEKQGLLVRERSTTDRRSVNLKLTRKGARLVPKLVADSKATNAKFLAGLTSAEKQGLQEIIRKMLANSDLVPGDI
jgi:DNA-binding MarR family transcriptional regulator